MDESETLKVAGLQGRRVCATGRLLSMTHAELAKIVRAGGGTFLRGPVRYSFLLVVGDNGWPAESDGSISAVFDRARKLKALGYAIEFLSEDDFLELIGLRQSAEAIRGRHTLSDLSRILELSTICLRRWLRLGLIQPVAAEFGISLFDFRQVAFLKRLSDLLARGVSLAAVRQGIQQASNLLPHGQSLDELLSAIEQDGRVLLRLQNRLLDQSGQIYLDFEQAGEKEATFFAHEVTGGIHDLCDQALAWEEAGNLAEAADAYRRALDLEPEHPTLHFDLGNVLFQLDQPRESIRHFRQAVCHDPDFAMAWHNLGSVLAHLRQWKEAEAALRKALALVPTYADSHFTLAEVLRRQGRSLEAAKHQHAYQQHSKADSFLATRQQLFRVVHFEEEFSM